MIIGLKRCIIVSILLFVIGALGVVFNKKNIIATLMAIEIMLLAVNLNFIACSVFLDDIYGQLFSLFIITVAAAESSIGLAILVIYARTRGNILISKMYLLRG
jgi:NADH-quinone oxidoreductase subunit K